MIRKVLFLSQASSKNQIFTLLTELALNLGFRVVTNRDSYDDNMNHQSIWQYISDADLIIGDLTKSKDNLIYEIGLAHGLQKPVVILAQTRHYLLFDVLYRNVVLYQETENGFKQLSFQLEETFKMMNKSDDFIKSFKGPLSSGSVTFDTDKMNENENLQVQLREILGLSGFMKMNRFEMWISNLLEKVRDWEITKPEGRRNKDYDFIIWNSIRDTEFALLGNPIPIEAKATKRIDRKILTKYANSLCNKGLKGMLLVTAAGISPSDRDMINKIYEDTGKVLVLLGIEDLEKIKEPADLIAQVKAKIASVLY